MNNAISPEAVLNILNDFGWHHRRELIPLARHISPELSCRAYYRSMHKDSSIITDLETKIRQGRARIVDEYIRRLKENQYIEVSGKGIEKQIRLIRRVFIDDRGKLVADLRRCPCCDSKPLLIDLSNFGTTQFRAECESCHLSLTGDDKQSVIKAWNRRQTPE